MHNDVDSRRRELTKQIDARLELLALRLEVHGPEAATEAAVRELRPVAQRVRNLLRSHGFSEEEIAELMVDVPPRHRSGCACWPCVIALHKAVRNHVAKVRIRHKRR